MVRIHHRPQRFRRCPLGRPDEYFPHSDRVLEYAESMHAEHEPLLPIFLTYPETAWLRSEPGFAALRQRIGLPK